MGSRFLIFVMLVWWWSSLFSQQTCSHQHFFSKASSSDSLDVLHYQIELDIVYLSQHAINGFTELTLIAKQNGLNTMVLDLQNLNVDSVFVNQTIHNQWIYNDTNLRIPLSQPLNISDTVICKVYYHGNPQKDPSGWGGFYFSNDSSFAFNMGVGMDDDPHNYGRIWFPCVDNFTDRATYDFNIRVKTNKMAICNGSLVAVNNNTNTVQYQWSLQHDIPTYLASVAVGPYVALIDTFVSINANRIPIAIYIPQNQYAQAQASFANLKDILQAFEHYYGPYRWERVGYVGVPFNSGAMEHATSIHIGLGYLNGTTAYETLIAHELSHHWFGDLVTCESAPDMWLNEGWAVFSESMYQEYVYGREAYKNNMRNELFNVLKSTHINDNGYRALAGIPHEYTYGSTVYDKGGTVAHSLRGYLGDSLFFMAIKAYMTQKAFSAQNSIQFRDFLTVTTGINMNDFFDAWVFSPGFCQFALDSFSVTNVSATKFQVNVSIRQALNHKPNFASSNRVPITLMDENWNRFDTIVQFSGATGSEVFVLPFYPKTVFVDLDERLADATTDYSKTLKNAESLSFDLSYFKIDVQQLADSVKFQIIHNWVAPDSLGISYDGLHISSVRYWTVAFNNSQALNAQGYFKYWKASGLDADIITSSLDSVVLLYRSKGGMPWQPIGFQKQGNWITGFLMVNQLLQGEYVLASYDAQYLAIERTKRLKNEIKISASPNPSSTGFHFQIEGESGHSVQILNVTGEVVANVLVQADFGKYFADWRPQAIMPGTYFAVLYDAHNKVLNQIKVVIIR